MTPRHTGILRRFLRGSRGAFQVEFAITFPVLILLSFGLMEFALLAFDYQRAAEASRRAVRHAVVAKPIPNTANLLADPPTKIQCTSSGGHVSCTGGSPAGTQSGGYYPDADARFQAMLAEMQAAYPPIGEENVRVTFEATDVGCEDCSGGILPLVTIELIGVEHTFLVGGLIGIEKIILPDFRTSVLGSGRIVNAV